MLSTPAILLLLVNLGLLWLLMAAPIGRRTIRMRRHYSAGPAKLGEALHPLGRDAAWYPSILSSEPDGEGLVRQRFSHADRNGKPIERKLTLEPLSGDWAMAYQAHVVEDSALDPSFWREYSERRMLRATADGSELIVEQTDRYRGLAFLIFRFFQLRRELKALDGWARTGQAVAGGVFERPLTQAAMAVLSTLVLWPFFGLTPTGLAISTMLTVVIAFHELGHLAAYRAFGHEQVRMIFIPLLGGVAIGGRPYNSKFEVATCALMGPGMSAFLVPAIIAFHALAEKRPDLALAAEPAMIFLLILGAFNLLNLLPMSRFDGGQVLRQIFSTGSGLLGATFLVTGVILWAGWRIGIPEAALYGGLAVMVLLSLVNQASAKPRNALVPLAGGERLFALFGYYAALAIHAYGLIYAADRLF